MEQCISDMEINFFNKEKAEQYNPERDNPVETEATEEECSDWKLYESVSQMKSEKSELKKLVREMIHALKMSPVVKRWNETESANVYHLELCVMSMYKKKIILSQRIKEMLDCTNDNERHILCLKKDFQTTIAYIDDLNKEITGIIFNNKIGRKKIEETEKVANNIVRETNELCLEVVELRHLTEELETEKKEALLEKNAAMESIKNEFEELSMHLEETEKTQFENINKNTKDIEELRITTELILTRNIDEKNQTINQQFTVTSTLISNIEKIEGTIIELKKGIKLTNQQFKTCSEKRVKWYEVRKISEKIVKYLKDEIEKYKVKVGNNEAENNYVPTSKPTELAALRNTQANTLFLKLKESNENLNRELQNLSDTLHIIEEISAIYDGLEQEQDAQSQIMEDNERKEDSCKVIQMNLYKNLRSIYNENVILNQRSVELNEKLRKKEHYLQCMKKEGSELCDQYDVLLCTVEKYEKAVKECNERSKMLEKDLKLLSAEHEMLLENELRVDQQLKRLNENIRDQLIDYGSSLQEHDNLKRKFVDLENSLAAELQQNDFIKRKIEELCKNDNTNEEILHLIEVESAQEIYLKDENDELTKEYEKLAGNQSLVDKLEQIVEKQRRLMTQENIVERPGKTPETSPTDVIHCDICERCLGGSFTEDTSTDASTVVSDRFHCSDVDNAGDILLERLSQEHQNFCSSENCSFIKFNILDGDDDSSYC